MQKLSRLPSAGRGRWPWNRMPFGCRASNDTLQPERPSRNCRADATGPRPALHSEEPGKRRVTALAVAGHDLYPGVAVQPGFDRGRSQIRVPYRRPRRQAQSSIPITRSCSGVQREAARTLRRNVSLLTGSSRRSANACAGRPPNMRPSWSTRPCSREVRRAWEQAATDSRLATIRQRSRYRGVDCELRHGHAGRHAGSRHHAAAGPACAAGRRHRSPATG